MVGSWLIEGGLCCTLSRHLMGGGAVVRGGFPRSFVHRNAMNNGVLVTLIDVEAAGIG